MPHLDGNEPYFKDSQQQNGFLKDQFFGNSNDIIGGIVNTLNERQSHAAPYESMVTDLLKTLEENNEAQTEFFDMLNELRAQGRVEMVMRKSRHHTYHTAEHAAEISVDVSGALAGKSLADKLNSELASAAAAWHDVEQGLGPPRNEQQSAIDFSAAFKSRLEEFEDKYPECIPAMTKLMNEVDYLSNELIVYPTWLVLGYENQTMTEQSKFFSKTLQQHANKAAEALGVTVETGPHMAGLLRASMQIEAKDTRRFADEDVTSQRLILNQLNRQGMPAVMQAFLEKAELKTDQEKEAFLGMMGQDIRMFLELNRPDAKKTNISKEAYHLFLQAFENAKSGEPVNEPKAMFDLFMDTTGGKTGARNIVRQGVFATGQQQPVWDQHAKQLEKFDAYYAQLNEKQKSELGMCLLTAASRLQPGIEYLNRDEYFLKKIVEAYEKVSLEMEKELPDRSKPLSSEDHTRLEQARKLLQSKENLSKTIKLHEKAIREFGISLPREFRKVEEMEKRSHYRIE